ncbi:hypothetical protein E4U34_004033 [Claviceps purpurea]|nr:hypothetical protein E4U34_004033 [Claviceps purpurea]
MNIALIALSAFYYSQWTLGPLIMMGPPSLSPGYSGTPLELRRHWLFLFPARACRRRPHSLSDSRHAALSGSSAISGVLIATLANFHDSGYYFAFFDNGAAEEYLRIIVGFGIMATLTHLAIFALARYERKMHGKVQSPPQVVYVHSQPYFAASPAQDQGPPPAYGVPTSRTHEVHAEHSIQELPATSDGMEQKKSRLW